MSRNGTVDCAEKNEAYDDVRFALVVYVGTPIALLGIVFNGILLVLFCNRKSVKSYSFYLLLLAVFDILICMFYIPFFTIDALAIYYQIEILHHLWHAYVMQLYGMSRFVQFGAVYMMLFATFERFIYVSGKRSLHCIASNGGRLVTITVILFITSILRFPTFFDYKIAYNKACPLFQDYLFIPVLINYPIYAKFNFYVMSVVQTIVPFIMLTLFNIVIIYMTRKRLYRTLSENLNCKNREELKYATRTMVAIVFTYLSCNIFSVYMSVMENIFPDSSLLFNKDGSSTKFYTITADLISILVALNSLLRMVVYMISNPRFRVRCTRLFVKHSTIRSVNRGAKKPKLEKTNNSVIERKC